MRIEEKTVTNITQHLIDAKKQLVLERYKPVAMATLNDMIRTNPHLRPTEIAERMYLAGLCAAATMWAEHESQMLSMQASMVETEMKLRDAFKHPGGKK